MKNRFINIIVYSLKFVNHLYKKFSATEGVKTRKRTQLQPTSWTTIPVLVKIFKVLISELSNEIENAAAANESSEVNNFLKTQMFVFLKAYFYLLKTKIYIRFLLINLWSFKESEDDSDDENAILDRSQFVFIDLTET